jgi:uncharacterized protein
VNTISKIDIQDILTISLKAIYVAGERGHMSPETAKATFHRKTDLKADGPTLIEGLPGHGLVASIAVDQITDQLSLSHHGAIRSDAFPPVTSFTDGRVQDTVRVYAGSDPDVMTLQSDVPIPPAAFNGLKQCVLDDLTEEFDGAIFLAGALAQTEEQRGEVFGVATTEEMKTNLADAGIDMADEQGAVSGVTGALVSACYEADVPAILLLVRATPNAPDPFAAASVIDTAIEPLVDFDIETDELRQQAEQIQEQKQQISQQLNQMQGSEKEVPMQANSMYQ